MIDREKLFEALEASLFRGTYYIYGFYEPFKVTRVERDLLPYSRSTGSIYIRTRSSTGLGRMGLTLDEEFILSREEDD